eukprot:2153128-Pleurochrysis_carterae.AAC.1
MNFLLARVLASLASDATRHSSDNNQSNAPRPLSAPSDRINRANHHVSSDSPPPAVDSGATTTH